MHRPRWSEMKGCKRGESRDFRSLGVSHSVLEHREKLDQRVSHASPLRVMLNKSGKAKSATFSVSWAVFGEQDCVYWYAEGSQYSTCMLGAITRNVSAVLTHVQMCDAFVPDEGEALPELANADCLTEEPVHEREMHVQRSHANILCLHQDLRTVA